MVRVVLTTNLASKFTGGETSFELDVASVRQLLRELDSRYPGLGDEIENAQLLAINGEIFQQAFLQKLAPDAEVYVLPKLGGG